jgi:hypothetical protein
MKGGLSEALSDMTPEQVQAFNTAFKGYSSRAQTLPSDTSKAVEKAERSLEDLDHINFGEIADPDELAQKGRGVLPREVCS